MVVHDAGQIDDTPYLVYEFIDGPTLAERLTHGPLPLEEATEVMATVAEALEHMHGTGIIHCDLKPSNILLDAENRPHLADFGLALRELEDTAPDSRHSSSGHLHT